MKKATEAQHDAAYNAYYNAVKDWNVIQMGRVYVVEKKQPLLEIGPEDETTWRFDDKETADRFLITKLLEEIANAVVSAPVAVTNADPVRDALTKARTYLAAMHRDYGRCVDPDCNLKQLLAEIKAALAHPAADSET